jgi:membrane-bound lytic murein transglycosylase B
VSGFTEGSRLLLRFISAFLIFILAQGLGTRAETPENLPDFPVWLEALRQEALAAGIRGEVLDAALTGVTPDMGIITRDRNQPEVKQSFADYAAARVNDDRIALGRERYTQYKELLVNVSKAYGVPAPMIAAVWGMESRYGSQPGTKLIVPALLTLAYDPRRSGYFRKELINALKILNDNDMPPGLMTGSWAGAMGQAQFMPSSYLAYAQDFTGDGGRDIWMSEADVFASIANYLKVSGWAGPISWGRAVKLPENFDDILVQKMIGPPADSCALRNHAGFLSLNEWRALGVRRENGKRLPWSAAKASLVRPDGPGGPAFLVYENYRAILKYNCSDYYALSVGLLADEISPKK